MVYIRERPMIRKGILNYCKKNGISIIDMFADYPCSSSIRKQLKKMLLEENMLDIAKQLKSEKK